MKREGNYAIRIGWLGVIISGFLSIASVCSAAAYVWTRKADMPTPRWTHTSAVVNGKIYIIGGLTTQPPATALSIVEEYDPVANTWTRKASMPAARGNMLGSSAVVDGKIYVIGGDDGVAWGGPTVEEYDPATNTWTRKADMPTSRWCLAVCAVDRKIYAIGGAPNIANSYTGLKVVEQYDPVTDTWTRKADMPTGLYGLCANVVNGKVYTVGGRPGLYAGPYVYQYDPVTDTWTPKSNMLLGTSQMVSVVMDDKMIVIGGWDISTHSPYETVQIYDPEMDIWTRRADAPFLRACSTADVVNNRTYVIGGTDRPHPCPATSTVYEFGPMPPDFDGSGTVDINDLVLLIERWGQDEPSCDIAPLPFGDGKVDAQDLKVLMSYWGQEVNDPTLIAHWKLDEFSGMIAADSAGTNNGTLVGNPVWQPASGKIGGALLLDGANDYTATQFVCDPSKGSFSVLVWVKGGAPGQAVLSQAQANGVNWLMAGASDGGLATELKSSGRTGKALKSAASISDGAWHRVGLVWDGANRILCVDGVEVAKDAQASLTGSAGGLQIGTGSVLAPGSFWSGLIDDIRIYNRAVKP